MSRTRPDANGYLEDKKMMLFDFMLDYVRQYIHETSKIIEREQQEISKKIDEYDKENPEEERKVAWDDELPIGGYSGYDAYEGEVMKYSEFTKILNSSILVSLYSFFEHSLNNISNSAGYYASKKLMPKDLEGRSYIQKNRKYIEKVLEIDLNDLDKIWQKITDYQKIRNLIVHNGSNYREDESKPIEKQQHHNLISKFKGIRVDGYGNFYIYDVAVLEHVWEFHELKTGVSL